LELEKVPAIRQARLTENLPPESRTMKKLSKQNYTLQEYLLDFIAIRVENIIYGLAGKKKKPDGLISLLEKEKNKRKKKKEFKSLTIDEFEKVRKQWQAV
jgi:hypothetical protein